MAEKKKYYWIKLKNNFFEEPAIDFLLSQKNGCEYIVLYQMICLKTSNNSGVLATEIGEMIVPFDADKITRDTKYFDVDTVLVALELYKKLGLVYESQDGVLTISNFQEMVGSETEFAKKKREYRKKIGQSERQELGHDKGQKEDIVRQEIEFRVRDKSIEKDIDKDKEIKDIVLNDKIVEEPAISILLNTKELYPLYFSQIEEWKELYPNVNVMQELRKMKGWSEANPTKRKTIKGILRFIHSWLSKEQDKPRKNDYIENQVIEDIQEVTEVQTIDNTELNKLLKDLKKGEL